MWQKGIIASDDLEINPQYSVKSGAATQTLTNMEIGKHYIAIPCMVSGSYKVTSGTHIQSYTGCECTFIANSRNCADTYQEYVCYCYYLIVPTEETVTVTFKSYSCTLDLIKLD